MTILDDIVAYKREFVASARARMPIEEVRAKAEAAAPPRHSPAWFGQRKYFIAHRVADRFDPGMDAPGVRKTTRKRFQDTIRDPCERAVGQTGDGVLLVYDQPATEQAGRQPAGSGNETAHAEHHRRPGFSQDR